MNESEFSNPGPLSNPQPVQPRSLSQPVDVNVQAEVAGLRSLFTATLIALLIIGGGLDLYLLRQMMSARKDLATIRPQAYQLFDNDKKEKPAINAFISQLQAYSATHPDFTPIFSKYAPVLTQVGLLQGAPAAANPQAPTLK
jgi:hypothetical protein